MSRSSPAFDLDADCYRRRFRIWSTDEGVVVSALEDDFHYFVVTLHHDGTTVTKIDCESKRWPWTTCPSAADPLRALEGMPLSKRFTAAAQWTDPKLNCSHQFDTACLAITHAAWGRAERVYDAEVQRRDFETGATRVRVWVDGEASFDWRLTWDGIENAEPPFDDAPWRGGFMRWADATLPPEDAESAIVLRRAADIGMGRGMDLDSIPVASQLPNSMTGICHTMRPGVAEVAFRNTGSIRDFARTPDDLLRDIRP
jgi:hypothetical protein